MFTSNRDQHRLFFIEIWRKHQQAQPLEPLETMILEVILNHPEYHRYLTTNHLDKDFDQTNPFLHMGLHVALREQLSTDRPLGIRVLYQSLAFGCEDVHALEHRMIDCLVEALWQSQRQGNPPDEQAYLACLQQIKLF